MAHVDSISVILIDDHSLFRAGLAELLQRRGIEVCASVSNGLDCVEKIYQHKPDIVLMDIRMPQINGLELLQSLKQKDVETPVVMVTTSRDEKDVATSLRLGARGYLLKDMEPDDLIDALYKIKNGETVIVPDLMPVLAKMLQQGSQDEEVQDSRLSGLTPREQEILSYIAEGGSNKIIARYLGITDGTVKLHVKSILRKLKVNSRVEAAVIAVEHGLGRKSN